MEIRNDPSIKLKTISELEVFIDTYQDRLVNHAFYRLGSRQDAEDVVQDIFVKIFTIYAQNKISNPIAYAWRMVSNACIDKIRARIHNKNIALYDVKISDITSPDNKETEIICREDFERINKLLDALPFEQAEVLRFRFVDGLSFTEISNILEIPVTTVKSRFKYGLDKVKLKFFNQKEVINAM